VAFRSQIMTLWSDVRRAGVASVSLEDAGNTEDLASQVLAMLYAEHSRPLLRLAALLVQDITVAERIVQDAFAAMCGERHRIRDPEAAAAFLLRAVIRGTRSAANRRPAGDAAGDCLGYGAVIDALRTLKSSQREALVLRYYASLSDEQAAAAMGVRLGELKAHVADGMAILRAILERESLTRE
jgi:DNA-directed RNA polymerase specialized sigma24 family protein